MGSLNANLGGWRRRAPGSRPRLARRSPGTLLAAALGGRGRASRQVRPPHSNTDRGATRTPVGRMPRHTHTRRPARRPADPSRHADPQLGGRCATATGILACARRRGRHLPSRRPSG